MKKNIKIILASAIAAVGVAASFGGAFALYTRQADNAEFSIGTYKHTSKGTITYEIGDIVDNLGEEKLRPTDTQNPGGRHDVIYKAPLGGYYSNDIPNQDYVYGNLRVDLSIPSSITGSTRWCVYVDGYDNDTLWDQQFVGLRRLTGEPESGKSNPLVGDNNSVNKDIAVNAVKDASAVDYPPDPLDKEKHLNAPNQWVVIYIDFSEALTPANFKTLAEEEFSIDIYFNDVSETCQRPVVVGDGNSWNKDAQEYGMVPNIKVGKYDEEKNPNPWEWAFKGITGFTKLIVRVHVDGTEEGDYYVKDTNGQDLTVDAEKSYDMYIKGVDGNKSTLYVEEGTTNYIKG